MVTRKLIFVGAALTSIGAAAAQDASVEFNGTVVDACTVVAAGDGTLGVDALNTILASTEAGGAQGSATVTTTASTFQVTVAAPTAFDVAPSGGGTNVTFASQYDATGATTASGVNAGTQTNLATGVTTVGVDASATKTSGNFPAGSYTMTTTVSCSAQ